MIIHVYTSSPTCLRNEIVVMYIASILSTMTVAIYIPITVYDRTLKNCAAKKCARLASGNVFMLLCST